MLQSIVHVGLFVSKILGAIFGALMLTFILGEFPGSLSTLGGMDLLLLILGGVMAIGFIGALYRPLYGGSLAVLSILGINGIALIRQDAFFEFDFPLQFALGLALVAFSLLIKLGEAQEVMNGNNAENSHSQ
jgi:hypothetical protein